MNNSTAEQTEQASPSVEYTSKPDLSLTEPFEVERAVVTNPGDPSTFVYYHRADFDGLASAAVVCHYLAAHNIEPVLVGWDYNDPEPDIRPRPGDLVYIVDLSIPCLMDHPNLVWIDHHKSAIETWGERPGRQLSGVAACRLAWNFFFSRLPGQLEDFTMGRVKEPIALTLFGEYDVFDLHDPRTIPFQYGAQAYLSLAPDEQLNTIRRIQTMFTETTPTLNWLTELVKAGESVARWIENAARRGAQYGQVLKFEGHKWWCINNPVGGSHWAPIPGDHAFEVQGIFKYSITPRGVHVSLYQNPNLKEGPDMSAIAKKWGGGGHHGAAGLSMTLRDLGTLLGWETAE